MNIMMSSWDAGTAYDRGVSTSVCVTFDGIEQIYGSNGNDVFRAGAITEALDGTRGVSFFGGGGNDNIATSSFDDFVDPGDGNDVVFCGNGTTASTHLAAMTRSMAARAMTISAGAAATPVARAGG